MKNSKTQTITLDAISRIVREEVGGMKKDIGVIKRKVTDIDQRLKDFAEDYTKTDLETRVVVIETALNIPAPAEENGM